MKIRSAILYAVVCLLLVPATSSAATWKFWKSEGKRGKRIYKNFPRGSLEGISLIIGAFNQPTSESVRILIGRRLTPKQTEAAINALHLPSRDKAALIKAWNGQSAKQTPYLHRTGGEEVRWRLRPLVKEGDLVDSLRAEDNSIKIYVRRGKLKDKSQPWYKPWKRLNTTKIRQDRKNTYYTPKGNGVWEVKRPDGDLETITE